MHWTHHKENVENEISDFIELTKTKNEHIHCMSAVSSQQRLRIRMLKMQFHRKKTTLDTRLTYVISIELSFLNGFSYFSTLKPSYECIKDERDMLIWICVTNFFFHLKKNEKKKRKTPNVIVHRASLTNICNNRELSSYRREYVSVCLLCQNRN